LLQAITFKPEMLFTEMVNLWCKNTSTGKLLWSGHAIKYCTVEYMAHAVANATIWTAKISEHQQKVLTQCNCEHKITSV